MGGGRFDGLPAREGEKGEDYVPGTPGYDHELLELLVDRYLGKSFWGKKLKVCPSRGLAAQGFYREA